MTERWCDVAHLGHAELLTPAPEASLEYFTALLGLTVAAEGDGSWYLRGYGDYEPYSLKLTASDHTGLGHPVRIYYETSKYAPPAAERPAMKSNHQRYAGRGASVRRLEHVNLMAGDVRACREFWADGFGLRTFEIIRQADGSEDGAWLSATVQGHEVIYVRDYLGGAARLHHLAFWVDSREDVLRAADLMNDAGVPIEAGPSRHIPIQGFYLYTREPGGNRAGTGSRSAPAGTSASTRTTSRSCGRRPSTPPSPAGGPGCRRRSGTTARRPSARPRSPSRRAGPRPPDPLP
jgi:catechol 2,3-dioxygenase